MGAQSIEEVSWLDGYAESTLKDKQTSIETLLLSVADVQTV